MYMPFGNTCAGLQWHTNAGGTEPEVNRRNEANNMGTLCGLWRLTDGVKFREKLVSFLNAIPANPWLTLLFIQAG